MAKFCNFSLAMNQQRNFTLEPYNQSLLCGAKKENACQVVMS